MPDGRGGVGHKWFEAWRVAAGLTCGRGRPYDAPQMALALSATERRLLLDLARAAAHAAVGSMPPPPLDTAALPEALCRPGASFVTVRVAGALRGCLGSLEAHAPLYADVRGHAAEVVCHDYRFAPVTPAELSELDVEVSVLSAPQPLAYAGPADLPRQLRPGVDGVILAYGARRATFLPQVWETVPDPEQFLARLCQKLGLSAQAWRHTPLDVSVYQVEALEAPASTDGTRDEKGRPGRQAADERGL
jgi:AmmeMemoRadiSam system protein A